MSYNRKIIVTIITVACTHIMIYCSFRRTSESLLHIIKPLQKYVPNTQDAMKKMYAPFRHKLYVTFIEPAYMGEKSLVFGEKLQGQFNDMVDAHDKFAQFKYLKWEKGLTPDQMLKHYEKIHAYKKAYYNYKNNPHDQAIHKELLRQTQKIHETMTHPQAPSTERRFDLMH